MNQFLIYISINIVNRQDHLKKVFAALIREHQITSASSVFKRKSKSGAEFDARMELVVRGNTEQSASKLKYEISLTTQLADLHLLAFENEIIMTPELTLPSPLLHADHIVVRAAAEVWPDYEHPILRKKLVELVSNSAETAEFLFQGRKILDDVKKQNFDPK